MLKNDGDIIRGLGFVALYASYLEEEIDHLLCKLDSVEKYDDEKKKWFIQRKIRHAKKVISKLNGDNLNGFIEFLSYCSELFDHRNEVIHGRIYPSHDRPDILKSGRPNVPDREIGTDELYGLANKFDQAIYAVTWQCIKDF